MNPKPTDASKSVPTVDLTPFTEKDGQSFSDSDRLRAGRNLVQACHELGFVKVIGHGVTTEEIREALAWAKRLFDLPYSEKMKAPHPPTAMPHRGYSGIGKEKVYSQAEIDTQGLEGDIGKELRKISDFKESYEIGSERDDQQPNIWLPEDVLPGFREYMSALYNRLAGVGHSILLAMSVGLGLDTDAQAEMMKLQATSYSQLRLLHYPAITKRKLENELFARLPGHNDWGAFTILFQDERGGLELRDPKSRDFLHAEPEEGALVLNVGDMLQRFSNDYFISAFHRVSVPDTQTVPESGIPARYSIPYFVGPKPSHMVSTLPHFVTPETPAKYQPIRFEDYGPTVSKYMYQDGEEK